MSQVVLELEQYERLIEQRVYAQYRQIFIAVLTLLFAGTLSVLVWLALRGDDPPPEPEPDTPVTQPPATEPPQPPTTEPPQPPTTEPPQPPADSGDSEDSEDNRCFWLYLATAAVYSLGCFLISFSPKFKLVLVGLWTIVTGVVFTTLATEYGCSFTGELVPCIVTLILLIIVPLLRIFKKGLGLIPTPAELQGHFEVIQTEAKRGNITGAFERLQNIIRRFPVVLFLFEFVVLSVSMYYACTSSEKGRWLIGVVVGLVSMVITFGSTIRTIAEPIIKWTFNTFLNVLGKLPMRKTKKEKLEEAVESEMGAVQISLKRLDEQLDRMTQDQSQSPQDIADLRAYRDKLKDLSGQMFSFSMTAEVQTEFQERLRAPPSSVDAQTRAGLQYIDQSISAHDELFLPEEGDEDKARVALARTNAIGLAVLGMEDSPVAPEKDKELAELLKGVEEGTGDEKLSGAVAALVQIRAYVASGKDTSDLYKPKPPLAEDAFDSLVEVSRDQKVFGRAREIALRLQKLLYENVEGGNLVLEGEEISKIGKDTRKGIADALLEAESVVEGLEFVKERKAEERRGTEEIYKGVKFE